MAYLPKLGQPTILCSELVLHWSATPESLQDEYADVLDPDVLELFIHMLLIV